MIKAKLSDFKTTIGASIAPVVQSFLTMAIDNLPVLEGLINQGVPVVADLMQTLLPPTMQLAQTLLPLILSLITSLLPPVQQILSAVLPVIIQLLDTLLPPLIQIVDSLLPPLLGLLQPLLDLLQPLITLFQPILDLVLAILQPLAQLITDLLTPLISVISRVIEVALIPLQSRFTLLSGVLSGTFNAALSLVLGYVHTMEGVFSGLIQFIKGVFTGDWKSAWEGVKKIFSSIWEGIKTAFKAPINWIIDGINSFIRGVNRIKIPDWVPIVGGSGFSIREIPRLAAGGVLEKGQTGFLEGNGAEAVVPLENNRKWIHSVARDMQGAGIGSDDKVVAILLRVQELLEQHTGMHIYLYPDKLVGELAEPLDERLARLQAQKVRN